jgi:hypothetical protein
VTAFEAALLIKPPALPGVSDFAGYKGMAKIMEADIF